MFQAMIAVSPKHGIIRLALEKTKQLYDAQSEAEVNDVTTQYYPILYYTILYHLYEV